MNGQNMGIPSGGRSSTTKKSKKRCDAYALNPIVPTRNLVSPKYGANHADMTPNRAAANREWLTV